MGTLTWHSEKLHFRDVEIDALVARSATSDVLVAEWKVRRETPTSKDEILVLRYPPSIIGEPIGYSPKGKPIFRPICPDVELWKVRGVGSFDSIRFAKAVFNAPEDEWFREGPASLEAIIAMLKEGFAEGSFRMEHVDSGTLSFALVEPGAIVTRNQRALLDRLNTKFFKTDSSGRHMRSVDANPPDSFSIGAV